jgi:hypothetical protein
MVPLERRAAMGQDEPENEKGLTDWLQCVQCGEPTGSAVSNVCTSYPRCHLDAAAADAGAPAAKRPYSAPEIVPLEVRRGGAHEHPRSDLEVRSDLEEEEAYLARIYVIEEHRQWGRFAAAAITGAASVPAPNADLVREACDVADRILDEWRKRRPAR